MPAFNVLCIAPLVVCFFPRMLVSARSVANETNPDRLRARSPLPVGCRNHVQSWKDPPIPINQLDLSQVLIPQGSSSPRSVHEEEDLGRTAGGNHEDWKSVSGATDNGHEDESQTFEVPATKPWEYLYDPSKLTKEYIQQPQSNNWKFLIPKKGCAAGSSSESKGKYIIGAMHEFTVQKSDSSADNAVKKEESYFAESAPINAELEPDTVPIFSSPSDNRPSLPPDNLRRIKYQVYHLFSPDQFQAVVEMIKPDENTNKPAYDGGQKFKNDFH